MAVKKAIAELEAVRNEDFHGIFIAQCVQEFQNLGWSTAKCIEKINEAKYKKVYGNTKFSDFTEDEEGLVNYELVKWKAKEFLEKGGYVDARTYEKIIEYNENLKSRMKGMMNGREGERFMVELKIKTVLKKITEALIMDLLRQTGYNRELDKKLEDFRKNLKDNIGKHIENELP